ncbi:DUF4294 domain-containing protein [Flavobacterium amniphilum]|uniref:DUF4294 domain-containing protein n=1 Tax=Flavobacterium amniphilum TaxID=1834035 RepID=UPI00202A0DFF|nr:DUF4294 domain-containing protein [Flavobacterium amniphilum]MCL9807312.1 DUF4294 domain-containing protein [Flavobacterium amniphilum]
MKSIRFAITLLFFTAIGNAQVVKDTVEVEDAKRDTLAELNFQLEEVFVSNKPFVKSEEERKLFLQLQRRVLKTYPYAKMAADRLVMLNEGMQGLKSERDKKKYFKLVENYLTNEFEAKLKKMSRKEGQILVKLIHRQTGISTFDLIHDLKSGWKAFWANNTARMFDINLKAKYDPYNVSEDFIIEGILYRAFTDGKLQKQPSKVPMEYAELAKVWRQKLKAMREAKQ